MEKKICINPGCDKWICSDQMHQPTLWKIILAGMLCPWMIFLLFPLKYFILKQTLSQKIQ